MEQGKPSILVIDDEAIVRKSMDALLKKSYQLIFAENGIEGMLLAIQHRPDVILLDVMMPNLSGIEVCKQIRAHKDLAEIPILMITALTDRESRLEGLLAGVDDFLVKPYDALELLARLQTITRLNRYRLMLEQRENLEKIQLELINSYHRTIEGWVMALDLRDRETEGHTQRVTKKAVQFAEYLGMDQDFIENARRGAILHDIGKLGVPDSILLKPGKLTPEEWQVMRLHPVYAYEWLKPIEYLKDSLDIPHYHHEKWDGSGYPDGLSGDQIPLPARIFAIIDVWDALGSDRPYRPAMPQDEILDYIKSETGRHFDPALVPSFIDMQLAESDSPDR
jgi:putative two-component system response regulator